MAPQATVYNLDGAPVPLGPFNNVTVVEFHRHFGCIFCKDHSARIAREYGRFTENGVEVIGVFQGPVKAVAGWADERGLPFTCVADPDRSAFRAWGLEQAGWLTVAGPKVLLKGAALFRHGLTSGLPHSGQDIKQLGGSFVIGSDNRIRWSWYSKDPSDNPPVELVLQASGC